MTVSFAGSGSVPGGPAHSRLSQWAVGLAAAVTVVLAVSYSIFGIAYAAGGSDAVEDTWVGYLGGFALVGGLAASFVAFVMAVTAKAKHDKSPLLRLPLIVFPALLVIVVLVETLWMD